MQTWNGYKNNYQTDFAANSGVNSTSQVYKSGHLKDFFERKVEGHKKVIKCKKSCQFFNFEFKAEVPMLI